jgi:hypothetical protein
MTENDAETDAWRHALYPRVLKREIHYVAPQLKLHNSEIRRRVRAHADWEKFIPEGAYDVFCRLHGPARMEDAIKLRMAHT